MQVKTAHQVLKAYSAWLTNAGVSHRIDLSLSPITVIFPTPSDTEVRAESTADVQHGGGVVRLSHPGGLPADWEYLATTVTNLVVRAGRQ